MAAKLLRAAIVGATTLLGKELAEELNTAVSAAWDLTLLDTNESAGQMAAAGDEALLIAEINAESFQRQDIVFFVGAAEQTREWWRSAAGAGASLVDLTGVLENEPNILVRAPGVVGGIAPDLTTMGVVVATPASVMLAIVATRLQEAFGGVVRLAATVHEPASQQGSVGLDEMQAQVIGLLSFQSLPKTVYDAQVAFNLLARLGEMANTPLTEIRERILRHFTKLLGASAPPCTLQVVQVPAFHGYTCSVLVDLERPVTLEAVSAALQRSGTTVNGETAAGNQAATETGELLIEVTSAETQPASQAEVKSFWLWMAEDNIKAAARHAVGCALELFTLRPVGGVQ